MTAPSRPQRGPAARIRPIASVVRLRHDLPAHRAVRGTFPAPARSTATV